jgi:hypothetical protein
LFTSTLVAGPAVAEDVPAAAASGDDATIHAAASKAAIANANPRRRLQQT